MKNLLHSALGFVITTVPLGLPPCGLAQIAETNQLRIYPAAELRFQSQPGGLYQLRMATNAAGPWTNFGFGFFGSGVDEQVFVSTRRPSSAFFGLIPGALSNTPDFSCARSLATTNGVRLENVKYAGSNWWVELKFNQNFAIQSEGLLDTLEIPWATNMVMTGTKGDWDTNGIAALYTDAAHDQEGAYRLSTDAAAFYAARDDQYLYFAYQLHDGDPDPATMYIAELQLFRGLYHAPADTIIMATQTPTHLWGVNVFHRESLGVEQEFDGSHVAVGSKFIEFKVPIAAIEYDGGGLFPKMGIQYRFLRAYIHYGASGDVNDPNSSYDGVADFDNRKWIVNFYPTKSQPGR